MEYNQGERHVPSLPELLECRNGKEWTIDRPGLGVTQDEQQITQVETVSAGGNGHTKQRPDG